LLAYLEPPVVHPGALAALTEPLDVVAELEPGPEGLAAYALDLDRQVLDVGLGPIPFP
jgi:hypothetical protein